ncbi:hypothetical protein niasHS_001244 [Heterodera schachtii]
MELSKFTQFNRKWANCRVSFAFDKFMLKKLGIWLIEMKKMAQLCKGSIEELCLTINSIVDDQTKSQAACRAYNVLKNFIERVPTLPTLPDLADLSLDEDDYAVSVLNKCSDAVQLCCQSPQSSAAALARLDDYISGMNDFAI